MNVELLKEVEKNLESKALELSSSKTVGVGGVCDLIRALDTLQGMIYWYEDAARFD